jgi:hypothetical protein
MPEGYVLSRLTGQPIPEGYDNLRPIAVVINNMYRALPQSGINQADIIYEVLAEGDITRLVGIFQAFDLPKIGSVRSARDYFIDFALDYDAIVVHHGASPSGYERLRALGIDHLDGMNLEGISFWRDRTYPEWYVSNSGQRPLDHSSYTGSGPIREIIENRGYRQELLEDSPFGFAFSMEPHPEFMRRGAAEHITVPFSSNYTRRFVYDGETQLYTVFNRDGAHMDAETQEPVQVRNIIIQEVKSHIIAGDPEGRRVVQTVGEGGGFLIADGFYYRILWKKGSHTEPIHWSFLNGWDIKLSTGRTWVCVFNENGTVDFNGEDEGE